MRSAAAHISLIFSIHPLLAAFSFLFSIFCSSNRRTAAAGFRPDSRSELTMKLALSTTDHYKRVRFAGPRPLTFRRTHPLPPGQIGTAISRIEFVRIYIRASLIASLTWPNSAGRRAKRCGTHFSVFFFLSVHPSLAAFLFPFSLPSVAVIVVPPLLVFTQTQD